MADDLDGVAHPPRHALVHDVDADVLVEGERPGSGEQEHGGEQPPLQLEPSVGAQIEELTNDGIAGAYHRGCDDQPGDLLADQARCGIDPAAHRQQRLHFFPPSGA